MQFSPAHVNLVRSSFAQLEPIAAQAAALFYKNLFDAQPALRTLFLSPIGEQGMRLMQMLAAAVALLDQPEQLRPILHKLGARHQGYGVQDWHYAAVGEALLKTLAQGLGESFGAQQRQAWSQVYAFISHTMQEPARLAHTC
ncbi:globin family protein [Paucibacter sp. APW11]|uniref:Globin family protein n=1 Tax=Roseateles aquae TaxID=3077235 RepID=A0ABU3PEB7_9BURK|nr:globin family protein [Paucibacter sp. APW11]MDT9000680.1 globin family protein [Paucibacter sp. APW11]